MKKRVILILSIFVFIIHACNDEIVEISEFILAAEVTNRHARNIQIDNAAGRIDFDLEKTESKTGVNIKLTLAEGVSMLPPAKEQANYNLTTPAEIKLTAGGRTVIFTIRAGVFDGIKQFVLAAEVTNKKTRHMVIGNDARTIRFEMAMDESKADVNIKLTLADGVSMVSPAAEQADYDLSNPASIELFADDRKVVFTVQAREFDPRPKLAIGVWVPPPPHLIETRADIRMRYKQIADAGINMVWGNHWNLYAIPNRLTTILDACYEFGIGFLPYLGVSRSGVFTESELSSHLQRVNEYKDHPAVLGFAMIDEPSASLFDRLAVVRREVDAILPEGKYSVANLFPTYATTSQLGSPDYETHVEEYMQKVQPQILSFDNYPLIASSDVNDRKHRDRYFISNLITIRNASIKYSVPFWGFIQAIGYYGMREPTLDEYRWLCNAHIAFGAKGFSYFLYSAIGPTGGPESFTNSMLTWDGRTTYLYDYAKTINGDFFQFSHSFMPFLNDGFIPVNQDVQMLQTIPSSLQRSAYGNLSRIETTGEMINGCFELGEQKAVYLFNWSKDMPMTAKLVFDKTVIFQLWGRDGLETEQTASELSMSFVPGEGKFLIFM